MIDEGIPPAFLALRDFLITNYKGKKAAGGRECVIRCPYCGDSKDPRSAHLYVGYNRRKNSISYHCFKCNTNGDVGIQFFRTLGIYDSNIINLVVEFNSSHRVTTNVYNKDHQGYQTNNSIITADPIIPVFDTPEYIKKLSYINNRIGGNLTFRDIQAYRIVLNLMDFLTMNGVTTFSRTMNIMDQLAFGFVGFLSADSTHVTLRRIVPEDKVHESISKRYTNYTIHENGIQMYCIREWVNELAPNVVCIAEGAFDILSLHYNFLSAFPNKIMFAACGKGVDSVIRYLVYTKRMSLINSTFHIFIDNDISAKDLINYKRTIISMGIPYHIHRNVYEGEKDYGVPASRIRDFLVQ